jgi:hypothetical protein
MAPRYTPIELLEEVKKCHEKKIHSKAKIAETLYLNLRTFYLYSKKPEYEFVFALINTKATTIGGRK